MIASVQRHSERMGALQLRAHAHMLLSNMSTCNKSRVLHVNVLLFGSGGQLRHGATLSSTPGKFKVRAADLVAPPRLRSATLANSPSLHINCAIGNPSAKGTYTNAPSVIGQVSEVVLTDCGGLLEDHGSLGDQ